MAVPTHPGPNPGLQDEEIMSFRSYCAAMTRRPGGCADSLLLTPADMESARMGARPMRYASQRLQVLIDESPDEEWKKLLRRKQYVLRTYFQMWDKLSQEQVRQRECDATWTQQEDFLGSVLPGWYTCTSYRQDQVKNCITAVAGMPSNGHEPDLETHQRPVQNPVRPAAQVSPLPPRAAPADVPSPPASYGGSVGDSEQFAVCTKTPK